MMVAPFIKWPGGKRRAAKDIIGRFPEEIGQYWEPFVGGGAIFFSIADRISHAVLSDLNEELVTAYRMVQTQVEDVIEVLRIHEQHHADEQHYWSVRDREPTDPIEIAGRFIYLNKTGFNGLYRVNRMGRFNVPRGCYTNPVICDDVGLREASKALQVAEVAHGDFADVVRPNSGDLVYCDPPYDGGFSDYVPGGFTMDDQNRLRRASDSWQDAGASVVLSNADTQAMRNLYLGWAIDTISAPRSINRDGRGRGRVSELVIQ